jgi:hypothetical protein
MRIPIVGETEYDVNSDPLCHADDPIKAKNAVLSSIQLNSSVRMKYTNINARRRNLGYIVKRPCPNDFDALGRDFGKCLVHIVVIVELEMWCFSKIRHPYTKMVVDLQVVANRQTSLCTEIACIIKGNRRSTWRRLTKAQPLDESKESDPLIAKHKLSVISLYKLIIFASQLGSSWSIGVDESNLEERRHKNENSRQQHRSKLDT